MERHPLGFLKRDLLRFLGFRVRLHVWSDADPQCHSHRWSFIGVAIRGRFMDHRWVEVPGNDHVRLECAEPVNGERPPLVNPESCSIRVHSVKVHRPLVPYVCKYGEIHSVALIGTGPHVSVVFIGRKKTTVSYVYRGVE